MENADVSRRMGSIGRKIIEKEYTIERIASRTVDLFTSCLAT